MKFITTNYELLRIFALLFIVDIIFIDISTTNVAAFRIVTWNNNIRSHIMQQIPAQCSLSSSYWSSGHKKQHKNRIYLSSYEEHVNIEDDDDEVDDDEDEISDEDLMASAGEWDEKVAKYNVVHLTGRVGFINEMKSLDDGKVVISLSIASTRKNHWLEKKLSSSSSSDNNAYDETDWYTLEVWGQKAEFISKFVDKGSRVSVIGQLQIDSWKDKETLEPRMKPKIIVREFEILETKAESELRRNNKGSSSSNSYSPNNNNSNNNYNNKKNNSGSNADREQQRGRSFFTTDDDDDDSIESRSSNYGSRPAGTGGFFDR